MRIFLYPLLARLLLICSVCLLTIAQTTSAFSSITLLEVHVVANRTPGFARHAVEEVGSRPVPDAGASRSSSSFNPKEPKEHRPDPLFLDDVQASVDWSCERQFHRRIPPRSNDDYN